MINLRKTLSLTHQLFEQNHIKHALIGGFALSTYGIHRATFDIDLIVEAEKKDIIKKLMLENGFILRFESSEVLQYTGVGFVDILLASRPLSLKMLENSTLNNELQINILKPEDIIGLKIQAYKNDSSRELQDKADIQNLLKLPQIDIEKVKSYAELFGEWSIIQKLMSKRI